MIGAVATKSTFGGVVKFFNCLSFIFFLFADLIREGNHIFSGLFWSFLVAINCSNLFPKSSYSGVQLRFYAYNKSLCKWGHFEKAKTTFKMLLATWFLVCFLKKFRSFNAKNLGSVGQTTLKLQAVKVGGLKKKSAVRPRPHSNHSAQVRGGPGSNHSQNLIAGKFAALWPTDPKFSALKDLNFLKKCTKYQKAIIILTGGLACSKRPYFNRT